MLRGLDARRCRDEFRVCRGVALAFCQRGWSFDLDVLAVRILPFFPLRLLLLPLLLPLPLLLLLLLLSRFLLFSSTIIPVLQPRRRRSAERLCPEARSIL